MYLKKLSITMKTMIQNVNIQKPSANVNGNANNMTNVIFFSKCLRFVSYPLTDHLWTKEYFEEMQDCPSVNLVISGLLVYL